MKNQENTLSASLVLISLQCESTLFPLLLSRFWIEFHEKDMKDVFCKYTEYKNGLVQWGLEVMSNFLTFQKAASTCIKLNSLTLNIWKQYLGHSDDRWSQNRQHPRMVDFLIFQ